jgi:hypothetical protein
VSPAGNERGQATALTILTPIRRGWALWLRIWFALAKVLPLQHWTLLRLKRIHFARFAIVSELDGRRLNSRHLLFESNFNGNWHSYLEAFCQVFPKGMWALWGSAHGWPGVVPVAGFKDWVHGNEFLASHYWSAYPEATTREILAALQTEPRLRALAAAAPGMDAHRFQAEWNELLRTAVRAP